MASEVLIDQLEDIDGTIAIDMDSGGSGQQDLANGLIFCSGSWNMNTANDPLSVQYNVASVTDLGVGGYEVNYINNFANSDTTWGGHNSHRNAAPGNVGGNGVACSATVHRVDGDTDAGLGQDIEFSQVTAGALA